ncbi:hypothetical protein FRB99_008785 [Tulasnella sp. 403]|nr:hypothetical protein FRB99_008785 [Tulasnella sp. 403]
MTRPQTPLYFDRPVTANSKRGYNYSYPTPLAQRTRKAPPPPPPSKDRRSTRKSQATHIELDTFSGSSSDASTSSASIQYRSDRSAPRKRARFSDSREDEQQQAREHSRVMDNHRHVDVCTPSSPPVPYATRPSSPYVTTAHPLKAVHNAGNSDTEAESDSTFVNPVPPVQARRVKTPVTRSPNQRQKALPSPPTVPLSLAAGYMKASDEYERRVESRAETYSTTTCRTPVRTRPPTVIVRTQTQSLSVVGGLKAVWKKATAHVRQVRRNGISAIIATKQRDSVLWHGFARVPTPTPDARSVRTKASSDSGSRGSTWWRTREIAIVGQSMEMATRVSSRTSSSRYTSSSSASSTSS